MVQQHPWPGLQPDSHHGIAQALGKFQFVVHARELKFERHLN
jgi:hypothetical protein